MAGRIRMPNKKTTITIAIIVAILAIVAIIGTVVFLKDRGSTEAAEIGNNQSQENGTTGNTPATPETNTNNGEVAGNPETLPNAGEQGNAGNAQNNPVANNGTQNPANGTVNNGGGVQNNQVAGNAGQNAANNIQETTIVENQTVYTETPWETQGVTWAPLSVNANLPLAEIKAEKDALEINKVCETKTGENLTTKGEELTYKITVKNNSGKVLEGIEVKDRIPSQTTYVDNSVDNGGNVTKLTTGKEVVAWTIDLKENEEKTLSFKVIVNATEGTIANVAVVNGEETNETHTAIVTSTKTAEVIGKKAGEPAKVGDKVTYTITVKNTGDVAGKANVKDESLAKLIEDGILEVEEDSKETAEKLMAGADVEVAANSESKVEFTVVVKKVSGAIKNVATIGEEKPEETIDTTDYTIKKEVTSTAKNENGKYALGEVVTYKVTVTNIGSTVLKSVTVNDENSEEKVKTATNIAVDGKAELEFTHKVTEKDIKEGKVINVATTSEGKETEKVTVDTEEPFEKYDLNKEVTGKDENKDGKYALGETITYKVTVTNRGNQTVKNVVVTDNNSEERTATVNGPIAPGESDYVTFTHIVTEPDIKAGKVVNVATIGDDSSTVTTETEKPFEKYDLHKEVTGKDENEDGKYALGEIITYKVTVTNRGNQTVSNVVVTDNNSEEKTATAKGPIAPGKSDYVTFTHKVTETDIAAKKVVNVATIGEDDSNEVTTNPEDPFAKYDLLKTVTSTDANNDGKYALGETIRYKVTVTNKGNQTVKDVVVTDNNSEEKTATVNGDLKPGESKDVEFTHVVTEKDIAAKKVVNVATIGEDDSNEVTTNPEDPFEKYDLHKEETSTAKNENGKYALGETITYKVTVTNRGNQTIDSVVVTDTNSKEGTATVNGKLKPGESKDVTFTHIVDEDDIEAGSVVNVATIGNDGSNEVITNTEDPFEKYDLHKEVTSTDENEDGKYALGETIRYKVTVTNRGNQTVSNVVVTDNNSKEKTATVKGPMAPGESDYVTFTHIVDEDDIKAGNVENVATIGNDGSNEVTTNTDEPNPNFVVTKTATKLNGTNVNGEIAVKVGDKVTYVITVENTGNVTLENVVVTDELLPEFSHTIATLNRGADNKVSVTVEYTVQEKDIEDGKLVNVAKATIPGKEVSGTKELPVSNISISKTVVEKTDGVYTELSEEALAKAVYEVGDTVWYAIKVTNNGEVADTATVTDKLPAGLQYVSASETINYNNSTITWNTELTAGQSKTLYIEAKITSDALNGNHTSTITGGDAWWTTDNSNKTIGKQAKTAQLFIRLDGNILGNDQDTTHTNDDYTGCVGTVNLSAKNLTGDDTPTTNENAIKIGSPSTLTTVEEYAQQNYKIFQYIVNGTDLTTIANNIKNDSKAQAKGITFDPETQMIVCYVMKTENDGYHIDAVIRDKSTIRVDLYNLKNVAVTNKEESEVTIKVSDTTELTKVVANKVWADPEHKLDSVDVELYANGIAQDNIQTLSESNGWTYTWEVEKYGNNGNKIDYSVKEISIDTENNTVTEYDDDNVTADNYKVTYETTGNTTTITNEFVQPNISVTKNQYDKDENPIANGTKVQYGDIITYRITATNSGNAEGTVTIKDTVPVNSELVANSIKLIQGTTTTLTETKLNNGVQVTLGANETATLEFTVRATAYAGEKVENTAHYNKDNEEKETPTETTQSNIETKTQVIPTSTSTTVTSAPQKVILVLDYSGSMNYDDGNGNTRVSALKTAANSFLETFLANGKNEVMVIRYATNATLACDFTTSKTDANNAINKNPNGGTNTHAGLEMANQYVDANTSVILMTDGLATYYNSTDWWGNTSVEGKGSGYDATADQKARDTATTIKGKGAKVYSIGFGLDDSRGEAMLQNIATPNTYNADGTIKDQYYFKAMNGDALKKAFEDISESLTTDGVHIPFTTENGKLIITKTSKVTVDGKEETVESFKEGQNVEIYTENYEQGKTEPFRTYTWKQFTELTTGTTTPLVTIAEDGTLTFDLTQYMKDNNIAASKKVTIRFVDPKSEEEEIETAQLMMMVMDIVEEAETDEDIAVYEQKIEEAEKAKTAPVEKDSKEETNTDTNTTNNNTANDNTVVDNKTDNTTSSTDKKEDIKDNNDKTSTEKPEVSEGNNTTTEEPVINNQNDKTDNTTSITTEE